MLFVSLNVNLKKKEAFFVPGNLHFPHFLSQINGKIMGRTAHVRPLVVPIVSLAWSAPTISWYEEKI